ncbi:MAG: glycosyltransferase, partial [Elusimicrobia bacterium]|nr:glycosyltransferase [Elusimicrobiota bacterium]
EFVTTCHGYYSIHLFSHVMGWGKRVIVISDIIGRHMIEDFGVDPGNIRLIPRSVDLERFPFRPRPTGRSSFTVVVIGRLTPLKGHPVFFEAMARVLREMPFVTVKVVGDAPPSKTHYKQSLLALVERMGITSRIQFLGNRKDIPQILSDSDVLVLPTVTHEAFGRVIIEAQAVGVPVVATKVGGVVDIIEDGQSGILVPPVDADAIATAVKRLLKDPALVDEMIVRARKRVEERYTLGRMVDSTLAVYKETLESKNILVMKLSAVGDVILATAAFRALREKFPTARIHLLVGREGAAVMQGCPYLDDVHIYDHKGKDRGLKGFLRLLKELRRYRFDMTIDLQNNDRTHLLSALIAPRASYGYKNRRSGMFLTRGIEDKGGPLAPVPHQFKVLEQIGIAYPQNARLELWPRKDDLRYARDLLHEAWIDEKTHVIVGVNISASERWPTKNWPMKLVAEFCDLLASDGIRVVVTGMEKDRPLQKELQRHLRSKPALMIGKTNLLQLSALIGFCRVYLSSDSAPLHVAASVGTPAIALFGPTDPRRHLPPGNVTLIQKKGRPCQPCYRTECREKDHPCMSGISSREVYQEVKRILKETTA